MEDRENDGRLSKTHNHAARMQKVSLNMHVTLTDTGGIAQQNAQDVLRTIMSFVKVASSNFGWTKKFKMAKHWNSVSSACWRKCDHK